jgi:hypothetical protein
MKGVLLDALAYAVIAAFCLALYLDHLTRED